MFVYLTNIYKLNGKIILVIDMIPERLKDIREDNDLKQIDMAEILKTTQANYSRWENGVEFIPLKKLTILCNYFDVSMDYVIGLTRDDKGNGKHNLDSKVIGKNLKILRDKFKITQNDLANLLHTSQSTISAYESGKTILLTAFAIQIVNKYKISLDWLCGRTK